MKNFVKAMINFVKDMNKFMKAMINFVKAMMNFVKAMNNFVKAINNFVKATNNWFSSQVCAPRWMNVYNDSREVKEYRMLGACYWANLNSENYHKRVPLLGQSEY